MKLNARGQYESLVEAYFSFRLNGYIEDLELRSDCLECIQLDVVIWPEDFQVDGFYLFKTNTCDCLYSVVCAISTERGLKGVLLLYCDYSLELLKGGMEKKLNPLNWFEL